MQPSRSLRAMRDAQPLVHNITNFVAMNVTANVLLAAGAAPAMIHAEEEAAEFAAIASALAVNIGTLSPRWVSAMMSAAEAAGAAGKPWALDPVAAGATTYRRESAARLLALKPTVIRGNASEILALAGAAGAGKGVDSGDSVAAARDAARGLAAQTGGVVVATGPADLVTDGDRAVEILNGHAMMPRITALGCALTSLVAAFAATSEDRFEAVVAALAYYGVAGETAARSAAGPGGFAVAFLDALYAIDGARLDAEARIRAA